MQHRLIDGIAGGDRSHDVVRVCFFLRVNGRIFKVSSNHRVLVGLDGRIQPVQGSPGIPLDSRQHAAGTHVDQRQFRKRQVFRAIPEQQPARDGSQRRPSPGESFRHFDFGTRENSQHKIIDLPVLAQWRIVSNSGGKASRSDEWTARTLMGTACSNCCRTCSVRSVNAVSESFGAEPGAPVSLRTQRTRVYRTLRQFSNREVPGLRLRADIRIEAALWPSATSCAEEEQDSKDDGEKTQDRLPVVVFVKKEFSARSQ